MWCTRHYFINTFIAHVSLNQFIVLGFTTLKLLNIHWKPEFIEKCYLISEGPVKNCLQNILNLFVEYWSRFTNTRTLQGKTIVLYCDFCLPTHACWIFICFVQKLMNMSMSLAPGGLLVNSPLFNQGRKGCRTTERCMLKLYSRKPSIQISSSLLSRQIA